MGPVTEPCRKTLVRNDCVLIAFFRCQKNAKNKKNDNFGSPIFRHFRHFGHTFSSFFLTLGSGRLRERPGRPQGPPRDPSGTVFSTILGQFFEAFLARIFRQGFCFSNHFSIILTGFQTDTQRKHAIETLIRATKGEFNR